MKDDAISRAAALDALGERPVVWSDNDDYTLGERNQYDMDRLAIETMPSAQLAQDLPKGCTDTISRAAAIKAADSIIERDTSGNNDVVKAMTAWQEYIKALPSAQPVVISKSENATECEDAVSREAVLNEIHRYMEERDYTIGLLDDNVCGLPPVTPKQPGWIPTSVKPPEPFKLVLIQDYCGCYELNTYIPPRINPKQYPNGYWGEVGNVDFDYFDVEAWCPLPAPYCPEGEEHERFN